LTGAQGPQGSQGAVAPASSDLSTYWKSDSGTIGTGEIGLNNLNPCNLTSIEVSRYSFAGSTDRFNYLNNVTAGCIVHIGQGFPNDAFGEFTITSNSYNGITQNFTMGLSLLY
jgi:hypothetical protein